MTDERDDGGMAFTAGYRAALEDAARRIADLERRLAEAEDRVSDADKELQRSQWANKQGCEIRAKIEARAERELDDLERRLARVIRERSRLDCRYAGEDHADMSGSHCEGEPCQRCDLERRLAEAQDRAVDKHTRLEVAISDAAIAKASAERAERERDEWKSRAEKWRSDSIEGHRQRDEALAKIERLNIAHGDDLARAEQAASEARAEAAKHKSIVAEMAKDMARVAQAAGYFGECEPNAVVGAVSMQRAEVERYVKLHTEEERLRYREMTRAEHAQSRLDRALALLREVEWAGSNQDWPACPSCEGIEPENGQMEGHRPDCRLAALLAETEDPQ